MIKVQISKTSSGPHDKPDIDEVEIKEVTLGFYSIFVADIPSLEWAFQTWGDLVITEIKNTSYMKMFYDNDLLCHVEIYDEYRE